MRLEPETVRLIRETLEEQLSRHDAAQILFDALSFERDERDLAAVLDGPLRVALLRRVTPEDAAAILRRVEEVVLSGAPSDSMPSIEVVVEAPEDERPTGQLPSLGGAASVMVFSATDELAVNLSLCLNRRAIIIQNVLSVREMTAASTTPPDLVLVDCRLPAPIDHRILASALRGLGPGVLCIVWGVDLELGAHFVDALSGADVRVVPIALSAGVAPILDLLMSRAPS